MRRAATPPISNGTVNKPSPVWCSSKPGVAVKDLIYEGEIIEYRVSPMTATSELTAAQNRLTISVNVRFINFKNEDDDFENRFSFYYDYPAEVQLVSIKSEAHDAIFERITQDIFNASLAKW